MRILADECCPRAIVERLREAGFDVRYAAETDARASDTDLIDLASSEERILITEDFDFGDLVFRDMLKVPGAVIMFLPGLVPQARAERLLRILQSPNLVFHGKLTVIGKRRVRQRNLPNADEGTPDNPTGRR